ncbi:hypothetical protein GCM10028857_00800 [Salinarchaeum chitinilyticum]
MGSKEQPARDGTEVSYSQEELYTTIYSARKDALLSTVATLIYLALAAFFIYGGLSLALSNSGTSSLLWGAGTMITGFVIAALATGVVSLPGSSP